MSFPRPMNRMERAHARLLMYLGFRIEWDYVKGVGWHYRASLPLSRYTFHLEYAADMAVKHLLTKTKTKPNGQQKAAQ